jgi:DNA polymerase-3 subunit delta'
MNGAVVGQDGEYDALLARARSLRVPHGLLLEGPHGTGKSLAARELAAALQCTAGRALACGSCNACAKVARGNHPDVHLLTVPEDKKVIPVEAVRAIQSTLGLTAVEGRARVVLIDPADRLTEQGQNALLKTLEEPGDTTFLVLVAARPESLLPTVLSRVQRCRMRPLGLDEMARLCCADGGPNTDRERRALAAARGSVGLARELLDEKAAALDDLLIGLESGRLGAFEAAGEALAGAEGRVEADASARRALRVCTARCRSALADLLLAPDRGPAYRAASDPWIEAAEAAFAAEEDLGVEIAPSHVLGELFLRWSELFSARRAPRLR